MFANDQRVNPIGTVLLQVHHCENALTVRGENPPRDTAIQIHFVNGIRSRECVTGRQPALFDRVMGIVRSRRESLGKSVRSEAADESTRCQIVPDQTTLRSPIIPDRSRADSPEREEPITAQEALRAAPTVRGGQMDGGGGGFPALPFRLIKTAGFPFWNGLMIEIHHKPPDVRPAVAFRCHIPDRASFGHDIPRPFVPAYASKSNLDRQEHHDEDDRGETGAQHGRQRRLARHRLSFVATIAAERTPHRRAQDYNACGDANQAVPEFE